MFALSKSVCTTSSNILEAFSVATTDILLAHADGKSEKEKSQEEWEFGFDFIEGHGPRDNTRNRMLRWVTIEVNKPDSPVYKWPPVLVEESLRNLSNDGVLAQVHSQWPLTLFDL